MKTLARVLCRQPADWDQSSQPRGGAGNQTISRNTLSWSWKYIPVFVWSTMCYVWVRWRYHLEELFKERLIIDPLLVAVTRTVAPGSDIIVFLIANKTQERGQEIMTIHDIWHFSTVQSIPFKSTVAYSCCYFLHIFANKTANFKEISKTLQMIT